MHSTPNVAAAQRDDIVYGLQERVRELEAMLGLDWFEPRVLKLTKMERKTLGILVKRGQPCSQQRLHAILFGDRDDPPMVENTRMHICHVRAKLRPFGITIGTIRSAGYVLDAENKNRLEALYAPGEKPNQETTP